MCEPAGYPINDSAEQDAITTLLTLLDSSKVKADIKARDKYPNVDGYLELVKGEKAIPYGKFEVQVRKVVEGTDRYSCPKELYAYSQCSSLPVLLIVVDVESKKSMWSHIYRGMPEYKEGQKSFTIKFSEQDVIKSDEQYLKRWASIVRDYNERIAKYPEMAELLSNSDTQQIAPKDREYFNRYTSYLNSLLDRDFQVIRPRIIPPHSSISVGIVSSSEDDIEYQHHRADYANNHATVFRVKPSSLGETSENSRELQHNWSRRDFLAEPRANALKFLKRPLEEALKHHQFGVHGEDLACNILTEFIEKYPNSFGLPLRDSYTLKELEVAYYQNLPEACAKYSPVSRSDKIRLRRIYLDHMEMALERMPASKLVRSSSCDYVIESRTLCLQAYETSLKVLLTAGVDVVVKPWADQGKLTGKYIWSYSDKEAVFDNLQRLFKRLVSNYSDFVRGNELTLNKSPYLDPNTAIIFNICCEDSDVFGGIPTVEEVHIPNKSMELPKVSVFMNGDNGSFESGKLGEFRVSLHDQSYKPSFLSKGLLDWAFKDFAYLQGVYHLLVGDLKRHYGYDFNL